MTTLATRGDGIVAADSQCTWGDTVNRVTKLFRLPCGGVIGGAGSYSEIVRAVRWYQAGAKGKSPKTKNCDLLIVWGDGRTGTCCAGIFTECTGPIAIGTGMQAALAAMNHFGTSALDAVQAAASVDPSTSGPFMVMAVEPPKRKARKAR